jgi:hypothetical protein
MPPESNLRSSVRPQWCCGRVAVAVINKNS